MICKEATVKKLVALIFLVMLLAIISFLLFDNDMHYNRTDKKLWNELSNVLDENRISSIKLISDKPMELIDEEKSNFINDLRKAQFYKSNWRKEGPTGPIIMIMFEDGTRESFQYWGNAVFETSYKNGQFLIKSNEVEQVLRKYGIGVI